jgi:hypothetical protein
LILDIAELCGFSKKFKKKQKYKLLKGIERSMLRPRCEKTTLQGGFFGILSRLSGL